MEIQPAKQTTHTNVTLKYVIYLNQHPNCIKSFKSFSSISPGEKYICLQNLR